jgi:hypothetical protein
LAGCAIAQSSSAGERIALLNSLEVHAASKNRSGVSSAAIMPSKRGVLGLLTRDELLAVVDRFELAPHDRRAKDGLVETAVSS